MFFATKTWKLRLKSSKKVQKLGENDRLVQIPSCFSWNQLKSADFRRRSSTKTALTFDSEEISPSNFCCKYPSIVAINFTIVGGNQKKSQIYRSKKPRKTRKTSILRRNQDFSNLCISDLQATKKKIIFFLSFTLDFDPEKKNKLTIRGFEFWITLFTCEL